MPIDWPEIPEIQDEGCMQVLAQYGQTMRYVQAYERTMKFLCALTRIEVEGKGTSSPMSDEDFDRLLSVRGALGQTLIKLRSLFDKKGIHPWPKVLEESLSKFTTERNFLAHDYLVSNSLVLSKAEAHEDLKRELKFFGESFKGLAQSWERWIKDAVERLTETTVEELEEQFGLEEHQAEEERQMEALRGRILGYKLDE